MDLNNKWIIVSGMGPFITNFVTIKTLKFIVLIVEEVISFLGKNLINKVI